MKWPSRFTIRDREQIAVRAKLDVDAARLGQREQRAKAGIIDAGIDVKAAHMVDHQRKRQAPQRGSDVGQYLAISPQLGVQAGFGQRRSHRLQIFERCAAGEICAGPRALAKARRAHPTLP